MTDHVLYMAQTYLFVSYWWHSLTVYLEVGTVVILHVGSCADGMTAMCVVCVHVQVKPLLEVTNTEEKFNQKETELKQVVDKFDKLKLDHDDLEKKHQQTQDEKLQLAEQLQAEVELCNEAEEVTP